MEDCQAHTYKQYFCPQCTITLESAAKHHTFYNYLYTVNFTFVNENTSVCYGFIHITSVDGLSNICLDYN